MLVSWEMWTKWKVEDRKNQKVSHKMVFVILHFLRVLYCRQTLLPIRRAPIDKYICSGTGKGRLGLGLFVSFEERCRTRLRTKPAE